MYPEVKKVHIRPTFKIKLQNKLHKLNKVNEFTNYKTKINTLY